LAARLLAVTLCGPNYDSKTTFQLGTNQHSEHEL